jgi:hypothetical protein
MKRRTTLAFPEGLGVIACRCVVEARLPVLFVSHAGGDWQFYCHWKNHDFMSSEVRSKVLALVHVEHLVAQDPTLEAVADLPTDTGAERSAVGAAWERYEDKDDE